MEKKFDETLNILVVEDDKNINKLISYYLKEINLKIFNAYDGIEALKMIEAINFDLILTDISMPNMNGMELIKRIRTDSKYDEIFIIILSALSGTENVISGLESGANEYITKPVEKIELLLKINNWKRIKSLQNDLIRKNMELSKAYAGLTEFDNIKNDILSFFSTELYSPLKRILRYLDNIEQKKIEDETKEELYAIKENINICLNITGRIKEFSVTKSAKKEIIELHLRDWLNNFLTNNNRLLDVKSLEINLDESLLAKISINTDEIILKNCIINLIDFCIKFANANTVISIRQIDAGSEIIIIFRFTSSLLELVDFEVNDKVFEPFYTIKNQDFEIDMGMNLFFAKKQIEILDNFLLIERKNDIISINIVLEKK